jgi:hypothetical protein
MGRILRKYWLGIAGLILVIVAVVLSVVLPQPVGRWGDILEAITISTGWVLFLLQYFYSKTERFYVWVNSLRLRLTNEPTKWNFTIDLQDCAEERPLHNVWEAISRHWQQATRWHLDDSKLIVNMPGYTLRVFVSDGIPLSPHDDVVSNPGVICIQLSNLELPFRTFRAKIENEVIPLIKEIADTLQPAEEKYVAKIVFSSTNPYFGFFVRRLDLPKVVSFTCDFIESSIGGRDRTVTVQKDRIDIVTDDLLALQALSLKYVALAGI